MKNGFLLKPHSVKLSGITSLSGKYVRVCIKKVHLDMMERHVHKQKDSRGVDSKKYEEKFASYVNHGFVALGIAIGHKVGLFSALRELSRPVTSQQLADARHLKERYVREWLGSMVAAELVFITDDNKYYIPDEVPDFKLLEIFSLCMPACAKRIDDVYNCFQYEGPKGFDYTRQDDLIKFLEEEKQQYTGKWLDDNLVPYSLKQKHEFKCILDIGCATGRATINLAKHFPDAHVIGIDVTQSTIDTANKAKMDENIKNVEFVKVGAEAMSVNWNQMFDWVVAVEVLHDLPDPVNSIKGIRRVLKDDGILSAIDPAVHSDHKDNIGLESPAGLLTGSCFVCLPCSLSCEPAVGNGIGWGVENRAIFLKSHGFKIIGDELTGLIHCKKA